MHGQYLKRFNKSRFFFKKQTHTQKKGKEILTQMHKLVYQHKGTNKHTQKGSYKKKWFI